jgi:undecaprenyl diphosphate synthase
MRPSTTEADADGRKHLPEHVAIIMDGNGRWARKRHLPRVEGHRNGAESAKTIIRAAGELGIRYLTLYAFSTENWNRPKSEVNTLMRYLVHYLKKETPDLNRNNVRLEAIGQIHRLPDNVRKQLDLSRKTLASNTGLTLILALSYSGRSELVHAVRQIAMQVRSGKLSPRGITEDTISEHLYTRQWPDPDLLIRTSGEMRVSNFLLWQISYTEFVITETLWPEFRRPQLEEALEEYARRHRRYGGL